MKTATVKAVRGECQVCGREYGASGGKVAHHGYRRPGGGFGQTRSCAGARGRPYAVACDALGRHLVRLLSVLDRLRAELEGLVDETAPASRFGNRYLPAHGLYRLARRESMARVRGEIRQLEAQIEASTVRYLVWEKRAG